MYKREIANYLNEFDESKRKVMAGSVKFLHDSEGRSWRWIHYALHDKSKADWERHPSLNLMRNSDYVERITHAVNDWRDMETSKRSFEEILSETIDRGSDRITEYVDDAGWDPYMRAKLLVCMRDLLRHGKSCRWIEAALSSRSHEKWEERGFGLMFDSKFDASVRKSMTRMEYPDGMDMMEFLSL